MDEVEWMVDGWEWEAGGRRNMDQLCQVCVLVSLSGVRGVAVRGDGGGGGRWGCVAEEG